MMGEVLKAKEFDQIYYGSGNIDLSASGKLKIAEPGLGWKESTTGRIITVHSNDIKRTQWLRSCRNYQLRITKMDGTVLKFEGFPKEAGEQLQQVLKTYYNSTLETKELSYRGWNWGQTEFQGSSQLNFMVGSKPAFEIPLQQISNTNLANKNEVSIEFQPNQETLDQTGGKKTDSLVEMRFFVPGMATKGQTEKRVDDDGNELSDEESVKNEDGEINQEPVLGEDGEAMSAAALLHDTIRQLSDIGNMTGEAIVRFNDVLSLTPRGRFHLALYDGFFTLRGKSHDYKVMFTQIQRMFLVAKPDDLHWVFILYVEPPLRQGQTRYPFLCLQLEKEEELECELNLEENEIKDKYEDRLRRHYDAPAYEVISDIFRGLTGKALATSDYTGAQNYQGIKCSMKANEAFLYPLERCIISFPKPSLYMPHHEISMVTFSRVASGAGGNKTFEMKISLNTGVEHNFSSFPREEYNALMQYCKSKKLHVETETSETVSNFHEIGLSELEDTDEDELKRKRGDDDDDSESPDEDFVDEDGSSSSESDSEEHDENESEKEDNEEEEEEEEEKPVIKKIKSDKPKDKQKKKKDPNAPKRGMSAYLFFANDKRPQVMQDNPGMGISELSKILGQMWKEASDEDRKKYDVMAAEDKARYQREMKAYTQKKNAGPAFPLKKSNNAMSSEFVESDEDE